MNDDIVTELRNISISTEWVKLRDWTTITTEAADEIERLRVKCKQWERVAEIYRDLHDEQAGRYAREDCTCYGCKAYAQELKREKALPWLMKQI